jgi:alpha-ketoglutarate-dependent taurine dioxygenase
MVDLDVEDLTPAFGAKVSGFDPKAPLEEDTRRALQDLFDRRGVLLFRDLDLTHGEQVRLSKMLIRQEDAGETDGSPIEDKFYISNRRADSAAPFGRLQFHSDTMWADQPFEVLSLYGVDVDEPTTPTLFVSAISAWKTLPDELRRRVEGLDALHTAGAVRRGDLTEVLVSTVERPPTTVAPIGRRHPRTGDTILYVCEQMTKEVVGLTPEESEQVLDELFAHLYDPAGRWSHDWRERDFIVWDNLAIQHARPNVTTQGPTRTLRKVASPVLKLRPDQIPSFIAPK